jgi:serine/threonine protein kinase
VIRRVGRYELHDELARGGMGSVHLGMLRGDHGFSRVVAIKRMHPHLASEAEFSAMFLDEARLAERIRHPNVVTILDVVSDGAELFLVMDLVVGQSLSRLLAQQARVPSRIVAALIHDVLHGLHAVHTASDADGRALGLVHRDVSPHNILVTQEGSARLLDFGVAKATQAAALAQSGAIRGKLAYIAPEQLRGEPLDARSDLFSLGVTAWEALTGRRLFRHEDDPSTIARVLSMNVPPPSAHVDGVDPLLERVIMRALDRAPASRFASARAMGEELEPAPRADEGELSRWLDERASTALDDLRAKVRVAERAPAPEPAPEPVAMTAAVPAPAKIPAVVAPSLPEPRRTGRIGLVMTALVVVAGVVGSVVFAARAGLGSDAAAPVMVAPARASVTAPPVYRKDDAATTEPVGAPSAREPPSSAPSSSPPHALSPRSSPHPPATDPACTPPYDLDGDGIKHWKRACLP